MNQQKKFIKVNLNDAVRVKLTEHGRAIHRKTHDDLMASIGREVYAYLPPQVDAEGWTDYQFWGLMHDFGAHIYMACEHPFELNILVENRESP